MSIQDQNIVGPLIRRGRSSVDILPATGSMQVEVLPAGDSFPVEADETILGAALRCGVKLTYGCAAGTCGSCKCKLVAGEVALLNHMPGVLSEQESEAGIILACQARPTRARTVIELPDSSTIPSRVETRGRIVKTQHLTHDILEVELELDGSIQFLAGQFALVQIQSMSMARCYSFAHRPANNGLKKVRFFIRKAPGGAFTEKLFSGELEGQTLEVSGPGGGFYLRSQTRPMLCVAGGSGLAPVLSILEDAARKRMDRKCVLIFGVRTMEDIYCLDRIRKLAERWTGLIDFKVALSDAAREDVPPEFRIGYVNEFLEESLGLLKAGRDEVEVYMAGPPPMIDASLRQIDAMGIPAGNIYFDRFTDSSH